MDTTTTHPAEPTGDGMNIGDEELITVRRQWNDWRTAR
jgi:hypothetical protein